MVFHQKNSKTSLHSAKKKGFDCCSGIILAKHSMAHGRDASNKIASKFLVPHAIISF